MAAFTTTPTEAGEGPSLIGIAKSIGAKIRDAAENAKEEREKAQEAGETPKKGSLFKSSLANQFNPIKSKKAKSNWAKQFSWNKPKDKPVTPPTEGDGANGSAKLKEFIAGGFTAILKDTGVMVTKLGGINDGIGQNLAATTSSSGTLTAIKETLDAQTDLRRKALEEAKYARAEKQLEKTQDISSTRSPLDTSGKGKSDGEGGDDGGGGGPFDWIKNIFSLDNLFNLLGVADIASNIPGKWLQKLNPFKKSPVTQGGGGKPPGPRMPGAGPRVTTSGGAPAAKAGGNWLSKLMPKGLGGAASRFGLGRVAQGAMGLASPIGWGILGGEVLGEGAKLLGQRNRDEQEKKRKELELSLGIGSPSETSIMTSDGSIPKLVQRDVPWWEKLNPFKMSEGGIVPSAVPPSPVSPMAEGGVVDNPTKTNLNPGDSVIPLNRNVGKKMFGGAKDTSAGETAVDTVGAMILGVASGMLGKTESGTAGDMVKQDIRKAAKEFGISNLTFTSSIGKAKFGVVDANKTAQDFMMALFKNITFGGGDGDSGGGGGGGNKDKPPGADLENTQVKNEVDLAADTHKDVGFTPGQQFGDRGGAHRGSDIGTMGQKGYYVALKKSGKVVNNSYDDVSGNWVGIDVGGGVEYRFMHLANRSHLKVGDTYSGETIGEIGNTGRSSGEHLHFEKLVNGKHVDPKSDASALLSIGRGLERNFDPKDTARPPVQTKPMGQDTGTRGAGDQASLPDANVTQVAQRGMIRKAQDGMIGPSWMPWNWGKVVDKHRSTKSSDYANQNSFLARQAQQREMMKELGYAKGGKSDVMKANAAKLKAKRASEQRSRLGVQKVNGKWVNMGVSDRAVGSNPWWQVWNKKGATAERKQKQEALAKSLADRLNKQEAAKIKPQAPKPRPAPPAAPASGVGPAPSASSTKLQTTAVVTPPVKSGGSTSYTASGYGGNVPSGRSMASTFADFLYADLIE